MPLNLKINNPTHRQAMTLICQDMVTAGGKALLVGGSIRDSILDIPLRDLDLEIYGITPDHLMEITGQPSY